LVGRRSGGGGDVSFNKICPLQPHLDSDVKNLVGVVLSSMASSSCEDLRMVKELHRQINLLLHLWGGCGLLNPFGDPGSFDRR
jgi:hypothetical protein